MLLSAVKWIFASFAEFSFALLHMLRMGTDLMGIILKSILLCCFFFTATETEKKNISRRHNKWFDDRLLNILGGVCVFFAPAAHKIVYGGRVNIKSVVANQRDYNV